MDESKQTNEETGKVAQPDLGKDGGQGIPPVRGPVRLRDVARLAGVSASVASAILSGGSGNSRAGKETTARIQRIARELQYRPNPAARRLRGTRSQLYGVLVASAGDPLVSFLVQFLDQESIKVGCRLMICNTVGDVAIAPDQFDIQVRELQHFGVDGVFCAVHDWFGGDRAALMAAHPRTVFYENPRIPGAAYVTLDREMVGRLAVRRLVERGCRRIGIALRGLNQPTQSDRLRGFRDEMALLGLPVDERLVFNAEVYGRFVPSVDMHGDRWRVPGEIVDRSVDALVRDGGADGLVVQDDFWAAELLRRLRSRGIRVPGDVAVVGYLNHYLADWTDPPLTTICRRPEDAARQMVGMLERMIVSGETAAGQSVVIQPSLIVRESA